MEKKLTLKLTDDQKREIASSLGVTIDQVGLHVAYGQAIDEDAKGNDAVIAKVSDKAADGKVWVVEQLALLAQASDGSNLLGVDAGSVAGGLQQAAPGGLSQASPVKDNATGASKMTPGQAYVGIFKAEKK